MKYFRKSFLGILTLSVFVISTLIGIALMVPEPLMFSGSLFKASAAPLFATFLVAMTVGTDAFNKQKILSFLNGVMKNRVDRYVAMGS